MNRKIRNLQGLRVEGEILQWDQKDTTPFHMYLAPSLLNDVALAVMKAVQHLWEPQLFPSLKWE